MNIALTRIFMAIEGSLALVKDERHVFMHYGEDRRYT